MRIVIIMISIIIASSPAYAAWRKAETPHFRIFTEGNEEGLENFANKVERFDSVLRALFKIKDNDNPQKLTIFMVPNFREVEKLSGQKTAVGFYYPIASGSLAVVSRDGGTGKYDLRVDTILFHEYAHHFMYRYFPAAYPAWYTEGFAEFISTTRFTREGQAQFGMPPYYRGYSLIHEQSISIQKLLSERISAIATPQLDAFYGKSWLLVHYLRFSEARKGQLGQYLDMINQGKPSIESATQAFGDLEILDSELDSYLRRPSISVTKTANIFPISSDLSITLLSSAESALVPFRLAMMRSSQTTDLVALAASLSAVTMKHPKEADAFRLLGEAYLALGNDIRAEIAADTAIALDPNHSRALLLKANVRMRKLVGNKSDDVASWKEMRSWIVRANRADTNDPMPLLAFYRAQQLQGGTPNALALEGLKRAHQMVPEDRRVRMSLALAYGRLGELDKAIDLVKAIAFSAHAGALAEKAQVLLEKLHRAKTGSKAETESFGENLLDDFGE